MHDILCRPTTFSLKPAPHAYLLKAYTFYYYNRIYFVAQERYRFYVYRVCINQDPTTPACRVILYKYQYALAPSYMHIHVVDTCNNGLLYEQRTNHFSRIFSRSLTNHGCKSAPKRSGSSRNKPRTSDDVKLCMYMYMQLNLYMYMQLHCLIWLEVWWEQVCHCLRIVSAHASGSASGSQHGRHYPISLSMQHVINRDVRVNSLPAYAAR